MFKTGDLVEPDCSFNYYSDRKIIEIQIKIGPPPWTIEEVEVRGSGEWVTLKGLYPYQLIAERFLLFIPAEKTEVDNWKNGLDLL